MLCFVPMHFMLPVVILSQRGLQAFLRHPTPPASGVYSRRTGDPDALFRRRGCSACFVICWFVSGMRRKEVLDGCMDQTVQLVMCQLCRSGTPPDPPPRRKDDEWRPWLDGSHLPLRTANVPVPRWVQFPASSAAHSLPRAPRASFLPYPSRTAFPPLSIPRRSLVRPPLRSFPGVEGHDLRPHAFVQTVADLRFMSSSTRETVPSSVPGIFSKVEEAKVGSYERYFVDGKEKKTRVDRNAEGERREAYEDVTNQYYDLATQFYEYGWGQSFHFAPMHADETLRESLRRHEHYLALRMGLTKHDRVLDVGCGIGGPLREMAHFAGSNITGINNNQGQVERAQAINKQHGVNARLVKGDFMAMPFGEGEFDAAYAIDATCHAPDLVGVYKEVFRVLKPGGYFAGYEWCMTDLFDRNNPEHLRIKREIEFGNGIADLKTTEQCKDALREAGYEVLEIGDRHDGSTIPWFLTRNMLWVLESIRLVPSGTCRVQKFLELAADSLAEGGKTGTFTPLYFFLVRKPLQ